MAMITANVTLSLTGEQVQSLKAREWISVKERLPKIGEEVLACYGLRTVMSVAVHIGFDGVAWFRSVDSGGKMIVSHWMPLPEPPEVK